MCPGILVCSHVKTPPLPGKGYSCGCCCGCQISHQPEPRSCFFHPLQRPPRSLLLCNQSLYRFCHLCLQLDSVSVCRQGWNATTCVLLSPLFSQTPVSASKFKDDTEGSTRLGVSAPTVCSKSQVSAAGQHPLQGGNPLTSWRNMFLMLWVEKVKTGDICGGVYVRNCRKNTEGMLDVLLNPLPGGLRSVGTHFCTLQSW